MSEKNSMPPNAKRVFKGMIFDVWQWEQKMYDGSVEVFERLKRPNTAVVVPIVSDKILVLLQEQPHRAEPFASLHGGRCEEGEEPLTMAKREFLEETGYTSDDWTLWVQKSSVNKIEWTVFTYIARNCIKAQEPHLDAGEKITPRHSGTC